MSSSQADWMIEQAVPEDAPALAAMHAESFKAAYLREDDPERNARVLEESAAFLSQSRIEARATLITSSLNHPETEFYHIATDADARPIGLIYGEKKEGRQEIMALYVSDEYFGKGVAKALVDAFIEWSDPSRPIELGVVPNNERAKVFYEKIGFHALGDKRVAGYDFLPETTMIREPQGGEHEV